MRISRCHCTPGPVGLLLTTLGLILHSGAVGMQAEQRASGTEHWQGKEIGYELSGDTRPEVRFRMGGQECRITVTIDGRERTVVLREEDVDVDGEHFDVGSYVRL